MRLLALDPGSHKCGYAVVDMLDGGQLQLIECGVFSAPANDNKWGRLRVIGQELDDMLDGWQDPGTCGIEKAFVHRDHFMGAETLAEARGVVAYVALARGFTVLTVAPSAVKKAVTGDGRADKAAVAEMVRVRFKLRKAPDPDAADACGVAIAIAQGAGK